jgi:hypothetical protein
MAVRAGNSRVGTRQCKRSLAGVIKAGRRPTARSMADSTILRETGTCVIRIAGGIVRTEVTGDTRLFQPGIHSTGVTGRTVQRCVRSRQWELSACCVIKRSVLPGCRTVANRTVLRETGSSMCRIHRSVVNLEVAGGTLCWRTCKNIILMAENTCRSCMRTRQYKSC